MLKAILSPMSVSVGATVGIGTLQFDVKNTSKVIFRYHNQSSRTTIRIGDHCINSAKKIDELLTYSGYTTVKDMYKDFGTGMHFENGQGALILYLLEFTEERFKFE